MRKNILKVDRGGGTAKDKQWEKRRNGRGSSRASESLLMRESINVIVRTSISQNGGTFSPLTEKTPRRSQQQQQQQQRSFNSTLFKTGAATAATAAPAKRAVGVAWPPPRTRRARRRPRDRTKRRRATQVSGGSGVGIRRSRTAGGTSGRRRTSWERPGRGVSNCSTHRSSSPLS